MMTYRLSSAMLLVMGVILILALGPLATQWPTALWLLAALWGLGAPRGATGDAISPAPRWRFWVTLALLLLALISAGWGHWLAMASAGIFVLLAVKAVELRSTRDLYQIGALLLLGLGVAAWTRVDLALGIYFVIELFLVLWALLWQGYLDAVRLEASSRTLPITADLGRLTAFILGFLLLLFPVMAGFFLLLPRTPTPLWHWGAAGGDAVSGFSPELDPRHLQRLALDQAVAFRARIVGPQIPSNARYWQGAILWQDDGGTQWRMGQRPPPSRPSPAGSTSLWHQDIVLSPGQHRYLFALSVPQRLHVDLPVDAVAPGVWRLRQPQEGPLRYEAWSGTQPSTSLSNAQRRAGLQLPPQPAPALLNLAHALRGKDAQDTVHRIMAWFRAPDFRYALNAPPGYPHGQTLEDFLLRTHTGFCEYYAAGLATLLRMDGVPARVVVGYRGGVYNPLGGFWTVRQSMAHAWVQAWLPGRGWVRLDATPGVATNGLASNAAGAQGVLTLPLGERVWSWMQWQWLNWVIDFSPQKQRRLWMQTGHWLGQGIHASPPSSAPMPSVGLSHWLVLIGVTAGVLGLGAWWRGRGRRPADPAERWRQQCRQALRRAGLRDLRPGAERRWLEGWSMPSAHRERLLSAIIHQRYGPRPDRLGHARLRQYLKSLRARPRGDRPQG